MTVHGYRGMILVMNLFMGSGTGHQISNAKVQLRKGMKKILKYVMLKNLFDEI